jgi:hypothetical protein
MKLIVKNIHIRRLAYTFAGGKYGGFLSFYLKHASVGRRRNVRLNKVTKERSHTPLISASIFASSSPPTSSICLVMENSTASGLKLIGDTQIAF